MGATRAATVEESIASFRPSGALPWRKSARVILANSRPGFEEPVVFGMIAHHVPPACTTWSTAFSGRA